MHSITYTIGDATAPHGTGSRIIAHICNDIGGWGRGFVLALSARWPEPKRSYQSWYADGTPGEFELGHIQLVEVDTKLWVANMIGQHDIRRGPTGEPPIRYDAVRSCLIALRAEALRFSASIHLPRIGAGLAGGDWTIIEEIIINELVEHGIDVTVYDLP